MTWLLMQAGWTAYQASCLAPLLWFLLAAGAVTGIADLIDEVSEESEGGDEQDETV